MYTFVLYFNRGRPLRLAAATRDNALALATALRPSQTVSHIETIAFSSAGTCVCHHSIAYDAPEPFEPLVPLPWSEPESYEQAKIRAKQIEGEIRSLKRELLNLPKEQPARRDHAVILAHRQRSKERQKLLRDAHQRLLRWMCEQNKHRRLTLAIA